MATKADLIKRGKELGLNLKTSMSEYELKARIKEAEENAQASKKEKTRTESRESGEY